MEEYDVIIIGAGPAGGECARVLTRKGLKVLLTDRAHNFSVNSYSSAGAPFEILSTYQLPEDVVGSSWNKFMIHSSKNRLVFESKTPRGVVMNFTKLRSFLSDETKNQGGTVKLGTAYREHSIAHHKVIVSFKEKNNQCFQATAKVLVDATGNDRQVLAKTQPPNSFQSTGIEYLVEVPDSVYEKWSHALSFFMGHKWMPQGYSWIFPMEPNLLKVGVGRYFQNETIVPHQKPFQHYLSTMMRECLGSDNLPIIDRHGKTIHYSFHHRDIHFHGTVIAIGDSVSTINPLAFEGIRHAMASARIAAKHITQKLADPRYSFEKYEKELKKYYGYKWLVSEWLMTYIYRNPDDETIEQMLEAYKGFTFDEIFNLGFHYDYRCALKFSWNFFKIKTKKRFETLRTSS